LPRHPTPTPCPYTTLFRSQILAQGNDIHSDTAKIGHGLDHLFITLSEPHHDRAFDETLRRRPLGVTKHLERLVITAATIANFRRDRKSTRLNSSHVKISYA